MQEVVAVLLGASARGALVLVAALALTSLVPRRPAAVRHAIWVGAIAVQLLLPVLALWGPHWSVPVPDALRSLVPEVSVATPSRQSRDEYSVPTSRTPVNVTAAPQRDRPAAPVSTPVTAGSTPSTATAAASYAASVPAPSAGVSLRTLLIALWALGAAAVLLRLAAGTIIVARLARRGARIDDGGWLSLAQRLANTLRIQRPLILLRGNRLGVPVTWGIVYPIVLLPDDADEWPEERRRYVLVHEMAHVKRLDALTQLLGQLALAVFWFNPLVWIANRRLQLEREHACDDYVLRHGTQPSTYAADLLQMVQSLGTPAHRSAQPAFAALAMARRSEFEGRMLSILDPVLDRHPLNRGRTLMSAFATMLLVVPLAALQPIRPAPQSAASSSHADTVSASRSQSLNESSSQSESATRAESISNAVSDSFTRGFRKLDSAHAALGRKLASVDTSRAAASSSIETISGRKVTCDQLQPGSSNATFHLHDNVEGDAARSLDMLTIDHDRCIQAVFHGGFTASPAEDRIATLSPGGMVSLRERTSDSDRALTIRPAATGSTDALSVQFRLNGVDAPFDAAAQRWLAGLLPDILAETSFNVKGRIARWRAEGGTDAALRHLAQLKSSGAKRAHYEALLDQQLPTADVERVVAQAGKDIPSSGDLRAVLSKAAAQSRAKSVAGSTLEAAIGAVASSGDRTAVLEAFGQTDDRDQLLAIMHVAETIPSSGDKANLLSTLAPKYLGRNDAALRDVFFKAAITIPSSGDLSNVLSEAIPFAEKSNEVAIAIIEAVRKIASSGDRSNVLIALAGRGAVRTPAARDAYLRTVQDIPSSTDMRNALEALARH
jgi:beta-lactamase regulating signal transducer with metallopeptidase domain